MTRLQPPSLRVITGPYVSFDFPRWRVCELTNKASPQEHADAAPCKRKRTQTLNGEGPKVRTNFIIVMIGWTGLAPWEFDSTMDPQHQPTRHAS